MFPTVFRPRLAGLFVLWTGIFYGSESLAELSFQGALASSLKDAPLLKARQAGVIAAQQIAIPAGALPDPKLSLGINNLPVEGTNRFSTSADFMTMREIGVMQEFPNRGKRNARVAAAQGTIALNQTQLQLDQLTVLRATAMSWITRHNLEQQLTLLAQLEKENRLLTHIVIAHHTAQQGMLTDTLLPRQEEALLEERRDELNRRRSQAQAELRRWLGDAADQPLIGDSPSWTLDANKLTENLQHNPALALYEPMSQVVDAEVAEARASKRPDWGVEVTYSQRGPAFENMASVKLTMDLPVFGSSRQTPRIGSKLAERDQLDAEREAKARELRASLDTDYADYEQLNRALERQRTVLVPLTEKKVALTQAAWQGNSLPLTELIIARREHIDAELKQVDLEGMRDRAAAQLYFTYGLNADDLLSLTAPALSEVSP